MTAIAHIHRMSHRTDPTIDPDIKIAMHRAFRQQGRYQQQAYPIHQEIINDYQKLLPLMQEASLPDLDTYDKLMRYQTSLNNQLSKQIGELVELEKTYAK